MTELVKTPFRYPGSKSSFTGIVKEYVLHNGLKGCKVVEPYAGSAAVTLALVSEGVCSSGVIVERDPLIYSFWKVAFSNPEALIRRIEGSEATLSTWHELRPLLSYKEPNNGDLVEMAFAALFFNRTNFSGVLHSGPIGGQDQSSAYKIDCRFNRKELLLKIQKFSAVSKKIEVCFGDPIDVIKSCSRQTKTLFYIDPPYFIQGRKLYRYYYKLKDHLALSKALQKSKFNWILSYDDHDVIKSLYEGFSQVEKAFQYSTRVAKNENELLITNLKIPDAWKSRQI